MSDNKSIQDALAEVQRKVNEERTARVSEIIDETTATMLDPSGKKIGTTQYERVPGSAAKTATTAAGRTAGRSLLGRAAGILGGPAVAGALTAAEVLKPTPAGETKSEFQRQKEMGISPKPMSSVSPAPKTSTDRTGTGISKVMSRGKETPAEPLKMAKVEPKTFSQAFSAARKAAGGAGGKFTYGGKEFQTNIKGEKYAPVEKLRNVNPKGPEAPGTDQKFTAKPATSTAAPLPPKRPDDLGKVNAPMPPSRPNDLPKPSASGLSSATKGFDSGKFNPNPSKNVSHIDSVSNTKYVGDNLSAKSPQSFKDIRLSPEYTSGNAEFPMSSEFKRSKPETESGKKVKKMSEDTNPLIAAFLKLQNENSKNMFEAAKKAKKDYDKDGKIESPKDEVWGSRFRAAKMAGKMEEGMIDPKDPSVQGSGDVTSTPAKKISMPKPTAPKTDSSVQGSGDVTMNGKPTRVKEDSEVTFSQAEIDHINSFFLEASVAPNRPEVAIGADSTSDKMSQNDVTATAESGKKIRKEEVELDEKLTDAAKANIRTALSDKMKKTSGPARSLIKLAKMNPANVKEETLEEHKSMDGDPLKVGDSVGFKDGHEQYGKIHSISPEGHAKVKVWDSEAGEHYHVTKHVSRLWKEANEEVAIQEGRPKKNPTPETTDRDPRKHIQVEAGRAAAGNVVDFHHNDGSKSKITPAMGRRIVSHLQGLKPADRQAAVNKMHDSAEGLKV